MLIVSEHRRFREFHAYKENPKTTGKAQDVAGRWEFRKQKDTRKGEGRGKFKERIVCACGVDIPCHYFETLSCDAFANS